MAKYNTEQRQLMLDIFKYSGHQTLSAADIMKLCGEEDISISAIYRNLKMMESEGVISKVVDKNRPKTLYHYVDPKQCSGVIHLKCEECENTYHLNRHISDMLYGLVRDQLNFSISESSAFLYGKCNNCSQNQE